MKKLLFLLLFLPSLVNGQFLNVGNTWQRQVVGTDTTYRMVMGGPGYWYPYTRKQIDNKFVWLTTNQTIAGNKTFTGETVTGLDTYSSDLTASFVTRSKIDKGYADGRYVNLTTTYSNPVFVNTLEWSKLTSKPTTLSGYGITDAMDLSSNQIVTGRKSFDKPLNLKAGIASDFQSGYGGIYMSGAGEFAFKQSNNTNELLLNLTGLSTSRNYTAPDANGTLALLNAGQTFTDAIWQGTIIGSTKGGSGVNNAGTLTWGSGGTLGTNAYTSTAYLQKAGDEATGALHVVAGSLTTPHLSARFNASNARIGFNVANSNGFPYIAYNANPSIGSDDATYDLSQEATRIRMDGGQFRFDRAVSGTAGNNITWINNYTQDASGNNTWTGRLFANTSISSDNSAVLYNSHASGYGVEMRGGGASNYALRVANYDNSVTALSLLGNGNMTVAGSGTFGGNISTTLGSQIIWGTGYAGGQPLIEGTSVGINIYPKGNLSDGVVNLAGALTGTSATFNNPGGLATTVRGGDLGSGSTIFSVQNNSGTQKFRIAGDGTANFTEAVTAPSLVVSSTPTTATSNYDLIVRDNSGGVDDGKLKKIASSGFVDLTTNQSIGGIKSFSTSPVIGGGLGVQFNSSGGSNYSILYAPSGFTGGWTAALPDKTGTLAMTDNQALTGVTSVQAFKTLLNNTTAANYAVGAGDHTILANSSFNNVTVDLPESTAGTNGRILIIKKYDGSGNTVTIDGYSSQTIDNASTKVLTTSYQGIAIQDYGSGWAIIGIF